MTTWFLSITTTRPGGGDLCSIPWKKRNTTASEEEGEPFAVSLEVTTCAKACSPPHCTQDLVATPVPHQGFGCSAERMTTFLREPHFTRTGKCMWKRGILAHSGVDAAVALCLSLSTPCTGHGVTQLLLRPFRDKSLLNKWQDVCLTECFYPQRK